MNKKIETLTREQEALIPVIREQWLNYILSCKNSLDKEKATKAIDWLYSFNKKKNPVMIFMDSPLGCQIAANYFKNNYNIRANIRANIGANIWDNIRDNIGDNIWDNIGANIRANIWDNIGDNIRDNIGDNIWDNIGANIRANIGDNIWDNIGANIRANIGDNIWDNIGDNLKFESFSYYGNCGDYGWVAFIDYFMQAGLQVESEDFNNFKELLLSGIYDMIQFDGMCIVSDMPVLIKRDVNNRLHNTSGYAVQWKDGFGMHYIHGRFINPDLFVKCINGEYTIDQYLKEDNDEIRSAVYEIIGSEKMLSFLEALLVDECSIVHKNGEVEKISIYRTREKLNKFKDEPYAWIKRICPSTGTTYLTPTNPAFNKALDAAKFHRPEFVPMEIDYSWYSRS